MGPLASDAQPESAVVMVLWEALCFSQGCKHRCHVITFSNTRYFVLFIYFQVFPIYIGVTNSLKSSTGRRTDTTEEGRTKTE